MDDDKKRKVVTLLIVSLLTVLFLLIYAGLSRMLEKEALYRLKVATKNSAMLINYSLRYFGFSAELASSLAKPLGYEDICEMMKRMSVARLGGLMVLRIGDDPILLFREGNMLYADKTGTAYLEWATAMQQPDGKTRYMGPLPSLIGSRQEMLVISTVYNETLQQPVSLALRLPLRRLIESFRAIDEAESGNRLVFLTTNLGELIPYNRSKAAEFELTELSGIVTRRSHDLASNVIRVELDGKDYLVSKNPIPDTDWSVLAVYPVTGLERYDRVLLVGLGVAWFCLVFFVFLLFYQAKRFGIYKILSEHDHLTGLGNRLAFEKDVRTFKEGQEYPFSLVMLDVDGLKLINDTLGHSAGDSLLRRTSILLQNSFRESDYIYRMGGDEFAIILPETKLSTARILLERLENNAALIKDRRLSPLFLSFGIAEATDDNSFATVTDRADEEMYEAKERHRKYRREKIQEFLQSWLGKVDRRGR